MINLWVLSQKYGTNQCPEWASILNVNKCYDLSVEGAASNVIDDIISNLAFVASVPFLATNASVHC